MTNCGAFAGRVRFARGAGRTGGVIRVCYDNRVVPGFAGWAQLNYPYGATEEDAAEKLKYDLFYVKNHDFMLDLMILIQTVEIVVFRRGAR